MKIVSCFSRGSEITPLILAGADELYCAVKPLPGFGPGVFNARELPAAVKKIHGLGKKLSLAVNAMRLEYSKQGLRRVMDRFIEMDGAGVDSFIISSPSIFEMVKDLKKPLRAELHLSSVQPCFNSLAARFFIRMGISRLILPNQLAPLEARAIFGECRAAGVETEIFDHRFFGCPYVNGRCNLHNANHHTFVKKIKGAALCRCGADDGRAIGMKALDAAPGRAGEAAALWARFSRRLAGGGAPRMGSAASFFDFFTMGANYLKYGTRCDPSHTKIEKVKALRSMLGLAEGLSRNLSPAEARAAFTERMAGWGGLACPSASGGRGQGGGKE